MLVGVWAWSRALETRLAVGDLSEGPKPARHLGCSGITLSQSIRRGARVHSPGFAGPDCVLPAVTRALERCSSPLLPPSRPCCAQKRTLYLLPLPLRLQEKRKRQTEIENKRRQLEDDRRQLQHLKVAALPWTWLGLGLRNGARWRTATLQCLTPLKLVGTRCWQGKQAPKSLCLGFYLGHAWWVHRSY